MEENKEGTTTVWSVLPEECVSQIILSLASPLDTCSVTTVSPVFRSAADSDAVWGGLLPSDYEDVLSRAVSNVEFSSKKQLFCRLCRPVLIDGGKKSFMLQKSTGKKCFMLSARELSITWGENSNYWTWGSHPDSRFEEVAVLLSVCWLEIVGRLKTAELSPNTTYVAYLIFKLDEGMVGLQHPNPKTSVCIADQQHSTETVSLLRKREAVVMQEAYRPKKRLNFRRLIINRGTQLPMTEPSHFPYLRKDGWLEVVMGEFFNETGNEDEVVMRMLEIQGGHWKSGLVVEGIEVRPKIIDL